MKTTHKNHPTHSEIATQAQIIWELRGRPEGQDQAIWLTAEQELRYDRKLNVAATRDRASALQHLDARSDAVQKELSELFPSQNRVHGTKTAAPSKRPSRRSASA